MSTISTLGVGSGLDLSGLLDKISTAESQPLQLIQEQQSSYNAKLSAYGQIKSLLSSFQTAAGKLADATVFQALKATSSAADVLTASASSTAAAGSYAVSAAQLAQANALAATGVASTSTAIGGGAATTVTIDFGTIAGTFNADTGKYAAGATFTPDATRTAVSLTINSTNNTLAGIRDAINKTSDIGVTASIVNDGTATPNRLVLTSTKTGLASSMRIAVTGDAAVQSLLAHDPTGTQNLKQTVTATDAALTVNGIAITSATNTVTTAIPGISLTLAKTGSSTVAVQRDTASVETAINDFVKAYNGLQSSAAQMTKYDPANKIAGTLLGDSTLRTIQSRIRSVLNTAQPGAVAGDPKTMSEIGISFQKDGTLAVDSVKLSAALRKSLDGVGRLFGGVDAATGYGKQISKMVDAMNATGGTLRSVSDGVSATLKSLDKQYTDMRSRITASIAVYRTQFQQLDIMVSSMKSTGDALTAQFAAMTSST